MKLQGLPVLRDFFASAIWVLFTAYLPLISPVAAPVLGGDISAMLAVTTGGLLVMAWLCELLGGACFNPVVSASLAAARKEPPGRALCRMAFQTLGGVSAGYAAVVLRGVGNLGSLAGGVVPGTSITQGAVCEFILSFLSCAVIVSTIGMKNKGMMLAYQFGATLLLILGGMDYTGPSMNPAVTFCWFWHLKGHDALEHAVVFWAGPLAGSILAGLLAREPKVTAPRGRRKAKAM
uniref:Aquaporin SIP n=1 Tax=Tetraselmis sp. GSL018 TaxID=582737 RepID=A0A061SEU6_9CHLO